MRNKVLLLALPITILAAGYITIAHFLKSSALYGTPVSSLMQPQKEENKQKAQKERFEREVIMMKDPSLGYIPMERLQIAEAKALQMKASGAANRISVLAWAERGPNNMGGRTRSLIISTSDATGNTVFAGSVSGGLWKTTNFKSATPTWTQISSVSANLAITALAQDPSNAAIMYAGTGEGYNNADAVRGLGIYKSTDGGTTWSLLASTTTGGANANDFSYVQKILVYTNGDVYASAISVIYCNNGGILKSTNGGTSWTRVIGSFSGPTCANAFDFAGYDIEKSKDGDLYATVIDNGNSFVPPAAFDTTVGKIFKSLAGATVGNAGTWTNVTPPPASNAGSYWQRIEIAPSLTNNNTIYAIMQGTASAVSGIRKTIDGGATWTNVTNTNNWCDQGTSTSPDFSRSQAWYDLLIAVNPTNDQTVFVGGVDLMRTTDGGATWPQNTQWAAGCGSLPYIHADNHNLYYFPGSSTEFIVVTDGGMFYSADGGTTYTSKNAGYNTIQYYAGAMHPTAGSNYMLAGAQDNGTHQFSTVGLGPVTTATGGDGGFCFVDQDNPNIQVTAYTQANYTISRNGGTSWNFFAYYGGGRFINPTDYDNTANLLFSAYNSGTFLRISNVASGSVSASFFTIPAAAGKTVSAVKVDPVTPNKVWFAFSGGVPQLFFATNTNTTSITTTQITLPVAIPSGAYISNVDVKADDGNRILLTVSNYGVASVYLSTNGGTSWSSLDNNGINLPDIPVRWASFVQSNANFNGGAAINGIMLATEIGVWTTESPSGTSTTWVQSSGVPNVRVDMLETRLNDKTVMAITHGRGVFTTILATVLPVTLLDFKGILEDRKIMLRWSTSTEQNTRNFDVEKSTDGVSYSKIGSMAAAGNSTSRKDYSLADLQVAPLNYYRLRTHDIDGKNSLSGVVLVRTSADQNMWVVNNPFKNYIDLRFAKEAKSVRLQLVNISGAIIMDNMIAAASTQTRWPLQKNIASGNYILRAVVDGKSFTFKLVKE